MSSHYGPSHYGGSHYASSHYGRDDQVVVPFVPGGGISDDYDFVLKKKRGVIQRNIRNLLVLAGLAILAAEDNDYDGQKED